MSELALVPIVFITSCLTAVIGITRAGGGWDVEGLIVDGPLPPAPASLTRE